MAKKLKCWKKDSRYQWIKNKKRVAILIPRENKGNYILSIPNKSYSYYPKLKNALRDANKYMKKHNKC